jgi:hypothetical protein
MYKYTCLPRSHPWPHKDKNKKKEKKRKKKKIRIKNHIISQPYKGACHTSSNHTKAKS